MLVKTKDGKSIINVESIMYIGISSDNISSNFEAVITAYFNNDEDKILGKYEKESDARSKLESFYRAYHENNRIFDF